MMGLEHLFDMLKSVYPLIMGRTDWQTLSFVSWRDEEMVHLLGELSFSCESFSIDLLVQVMLPSSSSWLQSCLLQSILLFSAFLQKEKKTLNVDIVLDGKGLGLTCLAWAVIGVFKVRLPMQLHTPPRHHACDMTFWVDQLTIHLPKATWSRHPRIAKVVVERVLQKNI